MAKAVERVSKLVDPSTNVDVITDAGDDGQLDETINEAFDDDTGDGEPVSLDNEEAQERLDKGTHKRPPYRPRVIEPRLNASHRVLSR